ncbi:MAG: hypothetical protein H0V47_12770, partial [Chloroflexia bacterium]|nr:hypothetical protein [Chloroflexia bacterium]
VLVLVLGGPILRLLERYRRRFNWEPWQELEVESNRSQPQGADLKLAPSEAE